MKKKNLAISAVLLASVLAAATAASAKETVRVGGLKGPTTMGIASLGVPVSDRTENNSYETTMVTAADELMAMVLNEEVDIALLPANVAAILYNKTQGGVKAVDINTLGVLYAADELMAMVLNEEVDIALLPANVAAILYNKTQGGVKAVDINTLGVLYVTEMGDTIHSVEDLKGKTLYLTGKGTSPDFVIRYLLDQHGLTTEDVKLEYKSEAAEVVSVLAEDELYLTGKGTSPDFVIRYLLDQHGLTTEDVKLEYKSEAAEVVSVLAEDEHAVGLLPQPFVTVAQSKNEKLRIALDLTEEWDALQEEGGSSLVTGVTVVRTEYLEDHEEAVEGFLEDHGYSAAYTNENLEEVAGLIEQLEIVPSAAIAQKAVPLCNIVCIKGREMQEKLGGYLEALHEMDPKSVGGALPEEDFYYMPE